MRCSGTLSTCARMCEAGGQRCSWGCRKQRQSTSVMHSAFLLRNLQPRCTLTCQSKTFLRLPWFVEICPFEDDSLLICFRLLLQAVAKAAAQMAARLAEEARQSTAADGARTALPPRAPEPDAAAEALLSADAMLSANPGLQAARLAHIEVHSM